MKKYPFLINICTILGCYIVLSWIQGGHLEAIPSDTGVGADTEYAVKKRQYIQQLPQEFENIVQNWQNLKESSHNEDALRVFHQSVLSMAGNAGIYDLSEVGSNARSLERLLNLVLENKYSLNNNDGINLVQDSLRDIAIRIDELKVSENASPQAIATHCQLLVDRLKG